MYPNGQPGPNSDNGQPAPQPAPQPQPTGDPLYQAPLQGYQSPQPVAAYEQAQASGQPSTNQNPQSANPFQVQPEPPMDKKKRMLITIIIAAGSLLVLAAVALYVMLVVMNKEAPVVKEAPKPLQSSGFIDQLRSALKADFPVRELKPGVAPTEPSLTRISSNETSQKP